MKYMTQHLFYNHFDWTPFCYTFLIPMEEYFAIAAHPALCPLDHFEYHFYSNPIKNEVDLYCAVFQQCLRCMSTIPLVCKEFFTPT